MKHYIYKTTCLINNKIYIGKHKSSDIDNDLYMGSGVLLKRDIDLYGIENFKREILFESDSASEISTLEREIVNEDFVSRLDTYNVMIGGLGGFDYINKNGLNVYEGHDIQVKTIGVENLKRGRVKIKRLCYDDPEYLQEHKKKISNALLLYFKKDNAKKGFLGKCHTLESKKKIGESNSKTQKGCKNSQYGTIWIYNLELKESKRILKSDPIPDGWCKGRKILF